MATPTMAIVKILKARREARPPPSQNVDEYRQKYRHILETVDDLGGEDLVDAITEWIIEETERNGELPAPEEVVEYARTVFTERDIHVPDDASLDPS